MRISDWSSDVCSSDLRGSSGSLRWRGTLLLAFRTDLRLSADAFRKGPGLGRIGLQSRGRGSAGAAFHKAGPRCGTYTVRHGRSEEHTYELQTLMRISYAVFCLQKKKDNVELPTQQTPLKSHE